MIELTISAVERPGAAFCRFAFFPDGKSLLVDNRTGQDAPLCVVDARTGAEQCRFAAESRNPAVALVVAPDGRSAAKVNSINRVDSLTFSLDARWLVSTSANSALVWDIGAVLREK